MTFLTPPLRAVDQLADPAFISVILRSLALSAASFAALAAVGIWGADWLVRQAIETGGVLAWLAGVFGGLVALLAAVWLFLPVAALIATAFLDRIADAVERRYYPGLPPARGASLITQGVDGLGLALRVLLLSLLALVLTLLLPGVGWAIGWAITAWGLGRGFFMVVAMRRMSRDAALASYRRRRGKVLAQGALLAITGVIPPLNLLVPVLGTAIMVHVLDQELVERGRSAADLTS